MSKFYLTGKRLYRGIRILLLTLFILLCLMAALLYFLLGTDSGYRQLPVLINHLTPYRITYQDVSGHLLGKQQWHDFTLRGPGIEVKANHVLLNIQAGDFLHKALTVENLELQQAEINLPATEKAAPKESEPLNALPEIHLPVAVSVKHLRISDTDIRQQGQSLLRINNATLTAGYRDSTLTAKGQADTDKGSGKLTAQVQTIADYPLTLTLEGQTPLLQPAQEIALHWSQSVLQPKIHLQLQGTVQAQAEINGKIQLDTQRLYAELMWKDADYLQQYHSQAGQFQFKGAFDDLQAQAKVAFQGKDLPAGELNAQSRIRPSRIEDMKVLLQTAAGNAAFNGHLDFAHAPAWAGELRLEDIDARKIRSDLDLRLNGLITTHGEQQDGVWHADVGIESLQGYWQGAPLTGQGKINYTGNQLNIDALNLNLAGNQITADGHADMTTADINLALAAPALHRLLPEINGRIQGKAHIGGRLQKPQLETDIFWNNLFYAQSGVAVFSSAQGKLHAQGDSDILQVSLQGQAQGKDFPPLQLTGSARLYPQSKAEDINVVINTLQGKIQATGTVEYLPRVSWDMHATAAKINPSAWLPALEANINTDITSRGSIEKGQPVLSATVKQLTGTWRKQPLSGAGTVSLNGHNLQTQDLYLRVGDNRLQLSGGLLQNKLALDFLLQGKQLEQLYPQISGYLGGKGSIRGKWQTPEIQAQLQGERLVFADNHIGTLQLALDSSLHGAGHFNNRIELQKVQVGEQQWQDILLNTRGAYNKHTLALQTSGGTVNLQLNGNGGFTAPDAWQGLLSGLNIKGEAMQWQLKAPTAVKFSPQDISVKDFCLQDRFSGLCLNLLKAGQTVINYEITELNPRSFAKFIPDEFAVKTALKGKGKITLLSDGQLRGDADLYLIPGTVSVFSDNQPPLVLKLKEAKLQAQFNDKQAKTNVIVDFADSGSVKGQALLSDYQQKNLVGQVEIHIPDLGRFKKFIPKAGDVQGKINGILQITGTADKPKVSGDIELQDGAIKIPEYATDLNHIQMRLSAHKTGQIDINGKIGTPEGDLTTQGNLFLTPLKLNLKLNGKNMLVANAKDMKVVISPQFVIAVNPESGVNINGKILIPKASVTLPDLSGGQSVSQDVVILTRDKAKKTLPVSDADSPVYADVAVILGDAVYFKNKDANIRLKGSINLMVRPGRPVNAKGVIEVASGIYQLYGQELNIQRGRVSFAGGNIDNPTVDVLALREIDNNVEVGASVKGPAKHLQLKLISTPTMPDSAILSYLLFGHPPDNSVNRESLLQMAAGLSLGRVFSDTFTGKTGLDVFDLGVSGLKAGKYIGKDLYVGLKSNFFTGITQFIARYQFTNRLNVQATAKPQEQAVDFLYEFEKN